MSVEKKGSFSRSITINHNVPSWSQGFIDATHAFEAAHDVDNMIKENIVAEVEVEAAEATKTLK